MIDHVVKADSGADKIIWILLAVFWVIAQLLTKGRGKGSLPQPPPAPPRPGPSIEDDLKQLFETISRTAGGAEAGPKSPPPPPPAPMRPIPYGFRPKPATSPPPQRRPIRTRLVPTEAARVTSARPQEPSTAAPAPEALRPMSAASLTETAMSHRAQPGSMTIPLSKVLPSAGHSFKLPAMSIATGILYARGTHGNRVFRGRGALRRAVISRIVLGPPKAFG